MSKNKVNDISKSRKYQLTINNLLKCEMTHENIKKIIPSIAKVSYWCMADEIGLEEKTPHTHMIVKSWEW